jgi:hypothetical protein
VILGSRKTSNLPPPGMKIKGGCGINSLKVITVDGLLKPKVLFKDTAFTLFVLTSPEQRKIIAPLITNNSF